MEFVKHHNALNRPKIEWIMLPTLVYEDSGGCYEVAPLMAPKTVVPWARRLLRHGETVHDGNKLLIFILGGVLVLASCHPLPYLKTYQSSSECWSGHKIDTLGGVFCFLGCPRTPKSQTGCPRGHPKILQGCPFYTQKKFRVSPVLVGPSLDG
jgi:hypothetical protein